MRIILTAMMATLAVSAATAAIAQTHAHGDHAPAPAMAQATQSCAGDPMPLPAALAGWTSPSPLKAAHDAASLATAQLSLGAAADLSLAPTPDMAYVLRPQRPAGSVSRGGMVGFTVTQPGLYRIALNSAVWVDLVADGKTLESVNHGNALACAGVRKIVDFKLAPGTYVIQFVGSGTPDVRVLVAALPEA